MDFEQYCQYKEMADNYNGDDYGDNIEKTEFNQEPNWSQKINQGNAES